MSVRYTGVRAGGPAHLASRPLFSAGDARRRRPDQLLRDWTGLDSRGSKTGHTVRH